jgi:NAD(P)-dependent dehydrogenase (short-subunit alcohol dehydrogenase family)
VRVIHAMLPLLRRSPSARIVNVASNSAIFANATDPGSMFARSHDEGARVSVHWATIGDDGPTGGFFEEDGPLPW